MWNLARGIALSLPDAALDCPFEYDFETTVMRHALTRRWFGLLMYAPGRAMGLPEAPRVPVLNLKSNPDASVELFDIYPGKILPAYHMNKTRWISVLLDGGVPADALRELICESYRLTEVKHRPL